MILIILDFRTLINIHNILHLKPVNVKTISQLFQKMPVTNSFDVYPVDFVRERSQLSPDFRYRMQVGFGKIIQIVNEGLNGWFQSIFRHVDCPGAVPGGECLYLLAFADSWKYFYS